MIETRRGAVQRGARSHQLQRTNSNAQTKNSFETDEFLTLDSRAMGRRHISWGERLWKFRGSRAYETVATRTIIVAGLGQIGVLAFVMYTGDEQAFVMGGARLRFVPARPCHRLCHMRA